MGFQRPRNNGAVKSFHYYYSSMCDMVKERILWLCNHKRIIAITAVIMYFRCQEFLTGSRCVRNNNVQQQWAIIRFLYKILTQLLHKVLRNRNKGFFKGSLRVPKNSFCFKINFKQ